MAFSFAGQWGPEPIVDRFGNAVYSATFRVLTTSGGEATVYTDRTKTTTTSQPLDVDGEGNATFYAAPGRYTIELTAGGLVTSFPVGVVPDAEDVAPAGDILWRTGQLVFDVTDAAYGAVGDGVTDDTTAIQAAITAANTAGGGTVFFPEGIYLVTATLAIHSNINYIGVGQSSIIRGSGFAIFLCDGATTSKSGWALRDLRIEDPTGNAATIGVKLDGGTAMTVGISDFRLDNVFIFGAPLGAGSFLGKGIEVTFSLKGVLDGVYVRYWDRGVELGYAANANSLDGAKIRVCNTGLFISDTSMDTVPLHGCTVEGNTIGIDSAARLLYLAGCHIENTAGATPTNIIVRSGGKLFSSGNGYYAAAASRDVIIDSASNAARHSSIGDTINSGITHNGTGTFALVAPTIGVTKSGTGPFVEWSGGSIIGTNRSGSSAVLSGHANYDIQAPLTNTAGTLALTAATGQTVQMQDAAGALRVFVDAAGRIILRAPTTEKVRIQKSSTVAVITVDDTGLGFNQATTVAQGAAIADADGTLADLTTKFNNLLAYLRSRGDIAT